MGQSHLYKWDCPTCTRGGTSTPNKVAFLRQCSHTIFGGNFPPSFLLCSITNISHSVFRVYNTYKHTRSSWTEVHNCKHMHWKNYNNFLVTLVLHARTKYTTQIVHASSWNTVLFTHTHTMLNITNTAMCCSLLWLPVHCEYNTMVSTR